MPYEGKRQCTGTPVKSLVALLRLLCPDSGTVNDSNIITLAQQAMSTLPPQQRHQHAANILISGHGFIYNVALLAYMLLCG